RGSALGVGMFVAVGLVYDVLSWLYSGVFAQEESISEDAVVGAQGDEVSWWRAQFGHIDGSLLLYSVLNGFYEEFFFLGMCAAVEPEFRRPVFFSSLALRGSIHTYQGFFVSAFFGMVLGPAFYGIYAREGERDLYPLVFAHVLADIFGVSALGLFFRNLTRSAFRGGSWSKRFLFEL
ncbi:CPBP family glutamic-type intramembrane protease, partial [Dermatophilus congolensis]